MPTTIGHLCNVCGARFDDYEDAADCETRHVAPDLQRKREAGLKPVYPKVGGEDDWNYAIAVSSGAERWLWTDAIHVFAAIEGERDGANWIAVVLLRSGKYASVVAGCDYTGWDCQASGLLHVAESLPKLYWQCLTDEDRERIADQLSPPKE